MNNKIPEGESAKCKFSPSMKALIKVRDGCQCVYCGTTEDLTIAHFFVPRYLGGRPIPENGVTLCRKCHDILDMPTPEQRSKHELVRHICFIYMVNLYGKPDLDLIVNRNVRDKRLKDELIKQRRHEKRHSNSSNKNF